MKVGLQLLGKENLSINPNPLGIHYSKGTVLFKNEINLYKIFYTKCSLKNSQHKWTAGVYLMMRASPLIEYSSTVLILCLWIGAITTVFSSLIGLFQQDIKKVIAYSTMSQLAREFLFVNQTIYVKVIYKIYNIFILTNSQITKAYYHSYNINSNNFLIHLTSWLGLAPHHMMMMFIFREYESQIRDLSNFWGRPGGREYS